MLGKLIKYEFKDTRQFMLLMYGLFLVLSFILAVGSRLNIDEFVNTISHNFEIGVMIYEIMETIVSFLFVIMNVVVVCAMFFYSIKRFKDNLLGDEGYLMHTLPVKTRDLILAKNIVSVVWTVLSLLVITAAYALICLVIDAAAVFEGVGSILGRVDWQGPYLADICIMLAESLVLGLTGIVFTYFNIYACMAIGFSSNTHRTAKSVGIYILFHVIMSMLQAAVMEFFGSFDMTNGFFEQVHVMLGIQIIMNALLALICYMITNYFLSQRLNLQ